MRLKLAYHRDASVVDIVIQADATATVGDVAAEIAAVDPGLRGHSVGTELTLAIAGPGETPVHVLDPGTTVVDGRLASGFGIRLVNMPTHRAATSARAVAEVVAGPDAGASFTLTAGASFVGRDRHNEVALNDPFVSKRHARIFIGDDIEIVDLDSANGLAVDGELVPRWTADEGRTVVLGDTELRLRLIATETTPAAVHLQAVEQGGIPVHRAPRVEARFPFAEYEPPSVPTEQDKAPFPWLIMLIPVLAGGLLYYFTRNPLSLVFVAMAPMMMLANFFLTRQRSRRRQESEVGRFTAHLERLDKVLESRLTQEQEVRRLEAPDPRAILDSVQAGSGLLWTRRPEHWSFLHLRLGTADQPSRTTVQDRAAASDGIVEFLEQLESVKARHQYARAVPVIEDLAASGAVGVVGADESAHGVVVSLVAQLVGLHSPAELVLTAVVDDEWREDLDWLKWLPHVSSPHSPLSGRHIADTAPTAAALTAALEALLDEREALGPAQPPIDRGPLRPSASAVARPGRLGEDATPALAPSLPRVVVLIFDGTRADRARLVRIAERGPEHGVHVIWVAPETGRIPAACRTFVEAHGSAEDGRVGFVRLGTELRPVRLDHVTAGEAFRMAVRMSAMVDSGAVVEDESDLPRNVPILSLVGLESAESPAVVVDRWQQNESLHPRDGSSRRRRRSRATLRALAGKAGVHSLHLDLRTQGPHALVGGTTGSGKSEFLQSWVLGMASEYSPERVTFLFVDYKGGAAFAECVELPHCVGLVTDLSPHLVRRSLTSLRAELQFRERLFHTHKVKDIVDFERSGDPACPPVLVIVIDEFAALAKEMPDFVDGVVDLAQRGRSLGIHLIMATQRPAGVIRDNLRANTNLRVALRMADETDSHDVLGTPAAAHFDPDTPGRAMVKTGPGRITPFQSAYAGGWSDMIERAPVGVHELRLGSELPWLRPEVEEPIQVPELGPNDLQRLVRSVSQAALLAAVPAPRRPWQPELVKEYDLESLGGQQDTALAFAVLDRPEAQDQAPVAFHPDRDGNLAIYGTSGSGKTVLLRTLAVAAGLATEQGDGPVEVYALDFAAGGLRMLEELPHVGSVIPGDDTERVTRLLRMLGDTLDRRAQSFSEASAGSLSDYRRSAAGRRGETRILVLIDNFPAFRSEYDGIGARTQWYSVFQQLLTDGRALGLHVVFTADRPASVPGAVASSVPRRVVLRLTDEPMYVALDVPTDILEVTSPPGRAVVGRHEAQVAVVGGTSNVADQAEAMRRLAARWHEVVPVVQPVASLPREIALADLPSADNDHVDHVVIGVADDTLLPVGLVPSGVLAVAGGPGSGRSSALATLLDALHRVHDDREFWYLGTSRSRLGRREDWTGGAGTFDTVAETAKTLLEHLQHRREPAVVVVESMADFLQTPADAPLVALLKMLRRSDHFLIAENDISGWGSSWPLMAEVKAGRRGLLLQPDALDGETVLRTPLPRSARTEFPPGRGYLVQNGKVTKLQLALPLTNS